jgi:hypothetical protein
MVKQSWSNYMNFQLSHGIEPYSEFNREESMAILQGYEDDQREQRELEAEARNRGRR